MTLEEKERATVWKPCPFCSGKAVYNEGWVEVMCSMCGASALPALWNMRPRENYAISLLQSANPRVAAGLLEELNK